MGTGESRPLDPLRIAVLAGGTSAERAISLESGAAVAKALAERQHDVATIDPLETDLAAVDWGRFDAVFVALHGTFGEDGGVQGILESIEIPFTGSGSATSRLAFRKSASKERFIQCGVPTPPYVLIHESDDAARIAAQADGLGYPLVVKPDAQGSSLGVSIVRSAEDLPRALTQCFHFGPFGVLEQAVLGTEWTIGLLDDLVLPAIEIETSRPFFDYHAKYQDEGTRYRFEHDAATEIVRAIEAAGVGAAQALGTRSLARVDLMLDRFHQPWVLEVNTVPGLTGHSLIPKAAARVGIGFGELCERAISSCLRRGEIPRPRFLDQPTLPQFSRDPQGSAAAREARSPQGRD